MSKHSLLQWFPTWGPWTLGGPQKISGGPPDLNFVLRLIGGGPQNIGKLILGVHSEKMLKTAGLLVYKASQ